MTAAHSRTAGSALVIGGSRGIGAATVARLADDGHAVAFTYLQNTEKATEVVERARGAGGRAVAIQADSSDAEALRSAVEQAVAENGPLSVLVVNAGLMLTGPIDTVGLDDLDLMLSVNVRGVYLAIQAASSLMVDHGRVVVLGSNMAERTGMPGTSVYQLTKAAVAGLVKGVALDLGARGITVNNIQPGPTDTEMNAGRLEQLAAMSPLRRVASPAEIAGFVSYLVGDDSGYITGASLTIDGGLLL